MFIFFKNWRRNHLLKRYPLNDALWQETVSRLHLLHGLTAEELARLRRWVTLFLQRKSMNAAGGLVLTDSMRMIIAAQACLPILNLDLDYYDGWVEIIVYPDTFVPAREYRDEIGLVHHTRTPLSGEAWHGGPLILSWHDAENIHTAHGHNVVVHEFAHKLDMLNGPADGFPPLHANMDRLAWSTTFSTAFQDFCHRITMGHTSSIDAYAAETPAEFFAVLSEVFFENPLALVSDYPKVYEQLNLFYRQDPLRRLG